MTKLRKIYNFRGNEGYPKKRKGSASEGYLKKRKSVKEYS